MISKLGERKKNMSIERDNLSSQQCGDIISLSHLSKYPKIMIKITKEIKAAQ